MIDFHTLMKSWLTEHFPQFLISQKGAAETILLYIPATQEELEELRLIEGVSKKSLGKWVASIQLYKSTSWRAGGSEGEVGVWDKDRRQNYFNLNDPEFFEKIGRFVATANPSQMIYPRE